MPHLWFFLIITTCYTCMLIKGVDLSSIWVNIRMSLMRKIFIMIYVYSDLKYKSIKTCLVVVWPEVNADKLTNVTSLSLY